MTRHVLLLSVCLSVVIVRSASSTNLIYNGDFELGDTGFTSNYIDKTYDPATNRLDGDSRYMVGHTPKEGHPAWPAYGDHTSGSGLMFMANGALDGRVTWRQGNITVVPGTQYIFTYFLSSWNTTSPAIIETRINDQSIGTEDGPTSLPSWIHVSHTWNSGSSTVATIELRDLRMASGGNDFMIDDISMNIVAPGEHVLTVLPTNRGRIILPGVGVFTRPEGAQVWLMAEANCGWIFKDWSDEHGNVYSRRKEYLLTIHQDCTFKASFDPNTSGDYADMSRKARDSYDRNGLEGIYRPDPYGIEKGDLLLWNDWIDWRADQITNFNDAVRDLANTLHVTDVGAYLLPFCDYYADSSSGQRYEDYRSTLLGITAMPMVYWQTWPLDVKATLESARNRVSPGKMVPVYSIRVEPRELREKPELTEAEVNVMLEPLAPYGKACQELAPPITEVAFFSYFKWHENDLVLIKAFCQRYSINPTEIIVRTGAYDGENGSEVLNIANSTAYNDLFRWCRTANVTGISIMVKDDESGQLLYQSGVVSRGGSGSGPNTQDQVRAFVAAADANALSVRAWIPMFNDKVLYDLSKDKAYDANDNYRMYVKYKNACATEGVLPVDGWVSPLDDTVRQNLQDVVREALSLGFDGLRIDHSRYECTPPAN